MLSKQNDIGEQSNNQNISLYYTLILAQRIYFILVTTKMGYILNSQATEAEVEAIIMNINQNFGKNFSKQAISRAAIKRMF